MTTLRNIVIVLFVKRITQTCPCNILQYFTAVKMIVSDEFFNFVLIFAQNFDCRYTLERPQAVLTSTHNLCFGAKIRNKYSPENPNFTII